MKFGNNSVFFVDAKNKKFTIEWIATKLVQLKFASNKKILVDAFLKREMQISTGFGNGVAIPHIMINNVKKPTILFLKLKNEINWNSIDGAPVNIVFVIAMPREAGDNHLKSLALLSKLIMDNDFISYLNNENNVKNLKNGLNHYLKKLVKSKIQSKEIDINKNTLRIAAVTSCPTGIAHTHMAAEALENYAKKNNIKIKVERQAAQGTENRLTKMDIDNANYIIIATGRPIDGKERFYGKKVVQTSVGAPLKNIQKIFDDLKNAKILKGTKTSNNEQDKVTPMQAILNGLSHMIPFVVVGGLFLAIALGVNGGNMSKSSSFWNAILHIGESAFSLMVVILGGYIAFAIGGRATLAPAMILTFICNGSLFTMGSPVPPNPFFYNYQNLSFGVDGANLGFFGAIAIGLMVGYAIKYWNMHVSLKLPKALRAVEPILITPIIFTFVGWVVFSFIGYLPLYYLSLGLEMGIKNLISLGIFWIAGLILGAMIAFDMGGPVNKIAFALGVMYIKTDPMIMGAVAAAGAVPPVGSGVGYLFGRHVLKVRSFNNEMDEQACLSGITMGIFGIAEGAIPYAIKHPKTAILSNILGGATASAIAAAFGITDVAAHTGPLVYIVGAIGQNGVTDYGYGLFYIMAMMIGIAITATSFAFLTKLFEDKKHRKLSRIQLPVTNMNNATKKLVPESK